LCFQKGASWVGASLLLDGGTPKQSILDHWDGIDARQEQLQRRRGAWSSEAAYVAKIARWHAVWQPGRKADPSYATLAEWTNNETAWHLANVVPTLQEALLRQLQAQRYNLFVGNQQAQESLHLPIPVVIQGAQQGGVLHAPRGGRVSAMLEPGESVWLPPTTHAQQRALMLWNGAFPRLAFGGIVPGFGAGGTVPAMPPPGLFVMDRAAAKVMGEAPIFPTRERGYQAGRVVQGSSGQACGGGSPVNSHVTIHLDNIHIRSDYDVERFADDLSRELERHTRDRFNRHRRPGFRGAKHRNRATNGNAVRDRAGVQNWLRLNDLPVAHTERSPLTPTPKLATARTTGRPTTGRPWYGTDERDKYRRPAQDPWAAGDRGRWHSGPC
jgi:hypothetical protein